MKKTPSCTGDSDGLALLASCRGKETALLALAFEWSSAQIPSDLPKPAAVLAGIVLLVAYLALPFALTYTVSSKVFGPPSAQSAAQR